MNHEYRGLVDPSTYIKFKTEIDWLETIRHLPLGKCVSVPHWTKHRNHESRFAYNIARKLCMEIITRSNDSWFTVIKVRDCAPHNAEKSVKKGG